MSYIEEQLKNYGDLEVNSPLSKHTTFKIGGNAKYFIYPFNEIALARVVEICKENNVPYKVIGKGSNLLCHDQDFEGCVINLDRHFTDCHFEDDGTCYAQAGISIILLAHSAMQKSLSGLEFASGIPATLGGTLFMNAGAYKSDMSQVVEKVYVLKDGNYIWMQNEELDYSYRHSIFQSNRDWIIVGACLKLTKGDQKEIKALMDSRRQRRLDTQPLDKPNAGSVFRNHELYPAWKVIDEIGYRGKKIGDAMVSEKHSNFIVNDGNAKAEDVFTLACEIQSKVKEKFGIELKMEVERFNWPNKK
jgi:UDP-N-acetylmuramate dehydrogenase